jgi:hypothetical protein
MFLGTESRSLDTQRLGINQYRHFLSPALPRLHRLVEPHEITTSRALQRGKELIKVGRFVCEAYFETPPQQNHRWAFCWPPLCTFGPFHWQPGLAWFTSIVLFAVCCAFSLC